MQTYTSFILCMLATTLRGRRSGGTKFPQEEDFFHFVPVRADRMGAANLLRPAKIAVWGSHLNRCARNPACWFAPVAQCPLAEPDCHPAWRNPARAGAAQGSQLASRKACNGATGWVH